MEEYLGPPLDIYWNLQKEHRSEANKDKIIACLVVWHFDSVFAKYLDLYCESEMNIHLDILIEDVF